jgi:hypothetical protein
MPLARHHQRHPNGKVDQVALSATLSCLAGCGLGEILDIVIGALLSAGLGFLFGYALTLKSLLRGGLPLRRALGLALAADALSTVIMEIAHAGIALLLTGAMHIGPHSILFWIGLAGALVVAAFAAYPANRWLIMREHSRALTRSASPSQHE